MIEILKIALFGFLFAVPGIALICLGFYLIEKHNKDD